MTDSLKDDIYWMHQAIEMAKKAEDQGEIPVGAILVADGEAIAEGWNQSISKHDPTAHAEIIAIREAGKLIENYRLIDTTLYVTLEPCPMCVGAMIHARIARVVFGASDYKTGAIHSAMNLIEHESHNHKMEYDAGVCSDICSQQLSDFFKKRRAEKKAFKKQSSISKEEER